MASRITELIVNCRDPRRLADFWCEVLGFTVLDIEGDDIEIGPAGSGFGGPQATLIFNRSDEPKQDNLRLHFDISPVDRGQEEELARLLAVGAVPVDVGQSPDASWHVLADPEGNEFCLLRTRVASAEH